MTLDECMRRERMISLRLDILNSRLDYHMYKLSAEYAGTDQEVQIMERIDDLTRQLEELKTEQAAHSTVGP